MATSKGKAAKGQVQVAAADMSDTAQQAASSIENDPAPTVKVNKANLAEIKGALDEMVQGVRVAWVGGDYRGTDYSTSPNNHSNRHSYIPRCT